VVRDQAGTRLERAEGRAKRGVALIGRLVEAVVRGPLLGHLPDAFDRIELGRVRRQAKQLDAVAVAREPELAGRVEVVARPLSMMRKVLRRRLRRTTSLRNARNVMPLKTGAN
jgi:hypothetical protein